MASSQPLAGAPALSRARRWALLFTVAAGLLLVREAGGKVCDFKGATLGRMDNRGPETHQIVAGNLKVAESLQKVLVNTGYAAEFDAKF